MQHFKKNINYVTACMRGGK